jgi:formylglycine-generating enzyme required for sulfatase activity
MDQAPNADSIGWYCANSGDKTHPVGLKKPNALGLNDMAGNVWEWTQDLWQEKLGTAAVTDPWGPDTGTSRVVRGASFNHNAYSMRASKRNGIHEEWTRFNNLGFRCVRTR